MLYPHPPNHYYHHRQTYLVILPHKLFWPEVLFLVWVTLVPDRKFLEVPFCKILLQPELDIVFVQNCKLHRALIHNVHQGHMKRKIFRHLRKFSFGLPIKKYWVFCEPHLFIFKDMYVISDISSTMYIVKILPRDKLHRDTFHIFVAYIRWLE